MPLVPSTSWTHRTAAAVAALLAGSVGVSACGSSNGSGADGDIATPLPEASCDAADGSAEVAEPTLAWTFDDSWQEAWLGSPAIVDLDDDGQKEVLAPRGETLKVWSADGTLLRVHEDFPGRIWSSAVVADLRPDLPGLEYAVAAREEIHAFAADGEPLAGFPFSWRDELRALAAGDIDGDGALELVTVTTSDLEANGQVDILLALHGDGSIVSGFPPNTTGAAGCSDACYVHAGFDQTLALGDVDGDGILDILVPQDNAYVSLHDGTGRAFDAHSMFEDRDKYSGIRFMLDYTLAQQGWGEDQESQAHFTNSAPAIADLDGDGQNEIILLGSVQNVAQNERERGVVVFVTRPDGTRPSAWEVPFHAENYLGGLEDLGDNIVAQTNQITVADINPTLPGPELVFAGFDGSIHALTADNSEVWHTTYNDSFSPNVLTSGVLSVDLSRDGRPEIVFSTYSTDEDRSALFVLSSTGVILHRIPLPGRGAMPVPSIADLDGDGTLEILVSLKDAQDDVELQAYTVAGSADNCLLWPTGRGNLWRTGTTDGSP